MAAHRYWLYMLLGRPFSQSCGVLQGRSDMFSDSVLAHPPKESPANAKSSNNNQRGLERILITMQDEQG